MQQQHAPARDSNVQDAMLDPSTYPQLPEVTSRDCACMRHPQLGAEFREEAQLRDDARRLRRRHVIKVFGNRHPA